MNRENNIEIEKTVEMAKCTLADMFEFKKEEFDRARTRKRPVIQGRRFLIYFLVNELDLTFAKVPHYVKSITSHCTAIHHFYKMMDFLEVEKPTRALYEQFKRQIVKNGTIKLKKELIKQIELRKVVNWNIKQLKGMIDVQA